MVSTIKKISLAVLFTILYGFSAQAQDAQMWMLDKSHTSVNFGIDHFFSEVKGTFTNFDGTFRFDPDNLQGSQFTFTVKVESVNTDNKKRDNHLRSEDFFNAKKFPEMKFVSNTIKKTGDKQYEALGKLTIKDVTKEVSLPFRVTGQMEHPMMKGTLILGLQFETTLQRSDYGVGAGKWATDMVVGEEVSINIPMELNRKK